MTLLGYSLFGNKNEKCVQETKLHFNKLITKLLRQFSSIENLSTLSVRRWVKLNFKWIKIKINFVMAPTDINKSRLCLTFS